jgi:vacuolar-type H+-ATPase subunit H
MEEIVSTDAIQGEILEDARKKAARLLDEAEAESARSFAAIESKAAAVVAEIIKVNSEKSARFRMETMARFPLERTRMRTSFVDAKLREAAGAYISALPEERVAALAEAMLAKGASFFAAKPVDLRRRGLSEPLARAAASRALASAASVLHVEDASLPAPGLEARSPDGDLSIRATMDIIEARLLDEMRGQLAQALCAEALAIDAPSGERRAP